MGERRKGGGRVQCTVYGAQAAVSLVFTYPETDTNRIANEEDARERLRRINNKVCRRVAVREWVTIVTKTLKEGSTP